MSEDKRVPPMPSQDQEAITVSADMLLAQLVGAVGPEFVVIPTQGWFDIVQELQKSTDEGLADRLQALQIPVVPVSLAPKEEENRIITPDDMPQGESKIILP